MTEYKDYVETFKRLYDSEKVDKTFYDAKLADGKITKEEYDYIVGE